MLRTATITDHRFTTLRPMSLALTGAALIATAACGGEIKDVSEVDVPSTPPVVATGPATDSSSGVTTEPKVVREVSLSEGETAYRERRYGDATALFVTYTEQRTDNPWGHYMLGLSAWKSGDLDRAEQAFVRSIELDRKHVKSFLNLARVHLDQGRPKEARKQAEVAMTLDSTSSDVYRLLGRVHASLGQPNEAIAAYRVALSHDPSDVWSMNNMGLLLIQQGRHEEALEPLALAVRTDSTVAVFQNNLGIALERTGQFTLATAAFQSALAADPGYTKAKLSLARVDGRPEDPSVPMIDLAVLAESFDRQIRGVQVGGPIPQAEPVPPPQR